MIAVEDFSSMPEAVTAMRLLELLILRSSGLSTSHCPCSCAGEQGSSCGALPGPISSLQGLAARCPAPLRTLQS